MFNKNFPKQVGPIICFLTLLLSKVSTYELNENQIVSMNIPDDVFNCREDLHIVVLNSIHGLNETHNDNQQYLLLPDQLFGHFFLKEQRHFLDGRVLGNFPPLRTKS